MARQNTQHQTDSESSIATVTSEIKPEGETNDLGLIESIPTRDDEPDTDSIKHEHDHQQSPMPHLEPIKSSISRKGNNLTSTLSRTLSKVRTSDIVDPGPPPDGGTVAWTQAVLSHLVIFSTWGFINSFGLFQSLYVDTLHLGTPSAVAWIGTVQVWILFNIGPFSGRATDAGFFKLTFWTGTVISLVGIFSLSFCKTYWQVFLAQGVCMGIGFGLCFIPALTIVSTYFLKKRSTALGITVTGSATGGLVFPAIAQTMLPSAGFAWTVRTMGFVQMACLVVVAIFMKPRLPPRKAGPLIEWAAWKEPAFALYLMCGFCFFWSVYIGFFFISSFGRSVLGVSQATSVNLVMALNGVGVVGRLTVNITATYVGPINLLLPFILATGVMGFGWIGVHSETGLWVFTCIYGITAAALQGLWPVVLTSLTSDPKKVGARTGMGFAWVGFAVLTGPPIGGALIETMNGNFLGCQIFAGLTMFVSASFLAATRWHVLRKRGIGWTWNTKV